MATGQAQPQPQTQAQTPVPPERQALANAIYRSLKRTHEMFLFDTPIVPQAPESCEKFRRSAKEKDQFGALLDMLGKGKQSAAGPAQSLALTSGHSFALAAITHQGGASSQKGAGARLAEGADAQAGPAAAPAASGAAAGTSAGASTMGNQLMASSSDALMPRKAFVGARPKWHAPWMLYRVISGPAGWVRCVTVEPNNEWFATGSAESVIKIWDLATGKLRLTLTGHVSAVRGLVVSPRHPYLFSCAEDKTVKCWDLETNRVVRHYHGHLSAVYSIDLHPTVDCLVTAGRDSTVRVWDVRTKANVHTFSGHTNTVSTVRTQAVEPQIVSSSHDSTVRLWDLIGARCRAVLTNHKKSVRALAFHPTQFTFASASPDNIKQWKFPDGEFLQNVPGHNAVVNGLAANADDVLVSAADNGSLCFFDWRSAYNFQKLDAVAQPGSIDSETGIFAITFDRSGSRIITGEADKTIKMYREDDSATEESHPLNWKPSIVKRARY